MARVKRYQISRLCKLHPPHDHLITIGKKWERLHFMDGWSGVFKNKRLWDGDSWYADLAVARKRLMKTTV